MRTNRDKTAQICGVYYLAISEAEIEDHPGVDTIAVSGKWEKIPFSKVEYLEKQSGSGQFIKQEFSATVTGMNQEEEEKIRKAANVHLLIRIDYTNSVSKVVGNENIPVALIVEMGGSPSTYTISFKRSSPEFSKYFKSF